MFSSNITSTNVTAISSLLTETHTTHIHQTPPPHTQFTHHPWSAWSFPIRNSGSLWQKMRIFKEATNHAVWKFSHRHVALSRRAENHQPYRLEAHCHFASFTPTFRIHLYWPLKKENIYWIPFSVLHMGILHVWQWKKIKWEFKHKELLLTNV